MTVQTSIVSLEPVDGFSDRIAWIRIRRASKRNAMNAQARDEFRNAMAAARDKYSVLAITGEGDSFCAGVDLKEVREHNATGSDAPLEDWRNLNLEIRRHPSIFIAAVNGIALGGGTTLVGLCDLAVAANEASIGLPEIGFGMYANPAGPATQLNLTRKRAAWLLLTAKRIDGPTAAEWGMVNLAVEKAKLENTVIEIAATIAAFDPVSLAEAKYALDKIPLGIDSWESAFAVGVDTNRAIARRSSQVETALEHFRQGGRNPGQG